MEQEEGMKKASEEFQTTELPPGFRFHPTDEEIITHYLLEKVLDSSFVATAIGEADLNKCEPWDLPKKAKIGEKEWYFFCQRDRKYPTGMRTNRATASGYWKATGKDKEIFNKSRPKPNNNLIGMKKTLVFYLGRAPKGEKTNWVMHEFRLSFYNLPKSAQDEWVVSRVFHKSTTNAVKKPAMSLNNLSVEDMLECSNNSLPPLTEVISSPNHPMSLYPQYMVSHYSSGTTSMSHCCKAEQSSPSLSQDTGLANTAEISSLPYHDTDFINNFNWDDLAYINSIP